MLGNFPGGSDGKVSACNAGDLGSIPGLGRSLSQPFPLVTIDLFSFREVRGGLRLCPNCTLFTNVCLGEILRLRCGR